MSYDYILFDLDGTLTDPKVGITKAVSYSLQKVKGLEIAPDDLVCFIGPPLKESYMEFYRLSDEEVVEAIKYYREYFREKGIFENDIYGNIKDMLEKLTRTHKVLAVATSKPTVFAERIVTHFGIQNYFSCVVGSNLDGSRTQKVEVIHEVFNRLDINKDLHRIIMVGDRKHDIIGANMNGITSVGVSYGYGSEEELVEAGASFVARSVEELEEMLTR